VISFGASSLGGCFRKVSEADCLAVVHRAIRSGINLIDTAPWYGHGKSETVLGKALKTIPRKAYYLNTKVGRYDPEPDKMIDFRAERVTKSVSESLERLGIDYIDCIQIHDPEYAPSTDIIVQETLPALQRLKKAGKVRFIGMTGYPLALQREIISKSFARGLRVDTSLTYCHYSMNDTTLVQGQDSFAAFCAEKNIGLINASPISMGLLSDRGPPSWHPAGAAIKAACAAASAYCRSLSPPVNISKLAMHFTLSNPSIPTTLVSTASPDRMAQNIRSGRGDACLTSHEAACSAHIMKTFFGESLDVKTWEDNEVEEYWQTLGRLLWTRQMYPKYVDTVEGSKL